MNYFKLLKHSLKFFRTKPCKRVSKYQPSEKKLEKNKIYNIYMYIYYLTKIKSYLSIVYKNQHCKTMSLRKKEMKDDI